MGEHSIAPARSTEDASETVPPRIGVIIAAYRAEAHLRETLESLRAQTATDWHCVVVDDGSDDRTAQVAAAVAALDPRVRLVRRENGGISAARNTGLDHLHPAATAVSFLDADDVLLPDAFARLLDALQREPAHVGVQALAELVDESGAPVDPGRWPEFQRDRRTLAGGRFVPHPAGAPTTLDVVLHSWRGYPMGVLLLRRDAVDEVGPFDVELATSEDWDYAIRLCRLGDLGFLDETVIRYRMHPGNHSADADRNRAAARAVRRKAFAALADDPRFAPVARRAWRGVQREEAGKALRRGAAAAREAAVASAAMLVHGGRWLRGAPAGLDAGGPLQRLRRPVAGRGGSGASRLSCFWAVLVTSGAAAGDGLTRVLEPVALL